MMRMIQCFLLASLACLVIACGQKGPLYLPTDHPSLPTGSQK